ncbi:glycosyltransferase [Aquamicrobium soli]|uniref:Glycosyltransferase n=1 Tax=Aquamicrobium soli TaxID=1811518 RepID=A0ABV7K7N6_9HYPH
MADITVVIPAHNAEKTIHRTLSSIPSNVSVIAVIDGRSDETSREVAAFPNASIVVNELPLGAARARNIGLEKVTSEYVTFLDADDFVEDGLHSGMVAAFSSGADAVFTRWAVLKNDRFREGASSNVVCNLIESKVELLCAWVGGQGCLTGSVAWKTTFLQSIGGWAAVQKADDYEIGIRTIIKGERFAFSHKGRLIYVDHSSPTRFSRVSVASSIEDQKRILSQAEAFAERCTESANKIFTAIGLRYYVLALSCFQEGHTSLGRDMLAEARKRGFHGHAGTRTARIISSIVGLENKVALASITRQIGSSLSR